MHRRCGAGRSRPVDTGGAVVARGGAAHPSRARRLAASRRAGATPATRRRCGARFSGVCCGGRRPATTGGHRLVTPGRHLHPAAAARGRHAESVRVRLGRHRVVAGAGQSDLAFRFAAPAGVARARLRGGGHLWPGVVAQSGHRGRHSPRPHEPLLLDAVAWRVHGFD
eukprot:ctg_6201.g494